MWIVGAGFSRSLGGPLMFDLLSLAARQQILAAYPEHIDREEADLIFWLFHCGAGFPEGPIDSELPIRGERRWQDAEQFLEILDNAQTDPAKEAVVQDVFAAIKNGVTASPDVRNRHAGVFDRSTLPAMGELAAMAKRMVAASCCTFLQGVDRNNASSKERWQPYLQWLRRLGSNDSILTFNYDRVVELLKPEVGNVIRGAHVCKPDARDDDDEARAANRPLLYKLHGSVDWSYDGNQVRCRSEWKPTMLNSDYDLAIATPGDSKMQMAGEVFKKLWSRAAQRLHEADEVFLIGFRFPQSDAFPRNRLLAPLRDNDKQSLNVHVVLGPDQNADLHRVLALLSWTVGARSTFDEPSALYQRKLIAHRMWAEDFLTVWAASQS